MNQEDYKIAYENVMVANKMLEKEIERLNNIINDLLKRQNEALNYISNFLSMDNRYKHGNGNDELELVRRILNKHNQELKGSNEPSFEEMVGFVEKVYKDIKSQSTLHEELEEERKTIAKIVGDFKEVNK